MAFSSLQNGMAQTRPYKMVLLCQVYWTFFFNKKFDIFIQKWSNNCIHTPRKTPGPFCRASTLSVTLLQAQFLKSHFVGFLPCHLFFLNFTNLILKKISIFARGQTVPFFLQTICWHSRNKLKPKSCEKQQRNATTTGKCKIVRAKWLGLHWRSENGWYLISGLKV